MAEKRGRGRPKGGLTVDKGSNSKAIQYTLALMRIPEVDRFSVEDVDRGFFDYLSVCEEFGIRPNMAGLAPVFGMDRTTLSHILHGGSNFNGKRSFTPESLREFKKVCTYMNSIMEAEMLDEKGNPVKWIFLAKNNFGYVDQKETITERRDPTEGMRDPKQIAAKYADMVDVTPKELPESRGESIDFQAGKGSQKPEKSRSKSQKRSQGDS